MSKYKLIKHIIHNFENNKYGTFLCRILNPEINYY